MSDQVQELLNIPQEFLKDGMQFVKRSQKRMSCIPPVGLLYRCWAAIENGI
jgi:hypothetical protein